MHNLPANSQITQIKCGAYHSYVVTKDNLVFSAGKNGDGQLGIGNTTKQSVFTKVVIPGIHEREEE